VLAVLISLLGPISGAHFNPAVSLVQTLRGALIWREAVVYVIGHRRESDVPWMVAGWIAATYWFTASTSFANPAITVARSLSDTFAGIRPSGIAGFVGAQLVGALLALWIGQRLFLARSEVPTDPDATHLTNAQVGSEPSAEPRSCVPRFMN